MPANIKDVARAAGVSSATVSRVLSGKPHVRPVLAKRVMQAVEELGYRPSRVARSLRVQKSSIIGLIISDIMNPFFTALVRAAEDTALKNGYAVFLCNTDENIQKEMLYIDLMQAEQVAGVLITPTRELNCPCNKLVESGIPIVTVDRRLTDVKVDTVLVDNVDGAYQAVCHLIERGHSRIAAFTAREDMTTGRERLKGYRLALQEHKIPFREEYIFTGLPKKETGCEQANRMLQLAEQPTAIFCGNNLLTMGVIETLYDSGRRIPKDYALVSFDDMEWYTMTLPTISAVQQPIYELGKTAAELLFRRIEKPAAGVEEILLKANLIVRDSSGKI